MNIYVGNLSYKMTDDELKELFADFGEVTRANIIKDRDTGQSKGFGFVEMTDKANAENAINALHDSNQKGRNIKVNEARPRNNNDRPQQRSFNNNRGSRY